MVIKMSMFSKIIFKCHKFSHLGKVKDVGFDVSVIHPEYISIGDELYIDRWCRIHTWPDYNGKATGYTPKLIIGNKVSFMRNCYVSCMNSIEIGDGCLFGDNVYISDNYHGNPTKEKLDIIPIERPLYSKGGIKIGKNVWVGRNVCIMPGVEIEDDVIIGANAVVTHSIKARSVVAGVPAKEIIKKDND